MRIAFFFFLLLVAAGCGGNLQSDSPAGTTDGAPAHLFISYTGTAGRVGHHMYAAPSAYCGAVWTQAGFSHIRGSLPPGLSFDGSRIQGTPQAPGRWVVVVRFQQPQCRGRSYPDQDVQVSFNIEGTAPRRLP